MRGLGITKPDEIDLEAIAWSHGAKVRYRPLHGCEARIFGHGDQAVISIDIRKPPPRQRYSLAHELGHWEFHRGRLLICRSVDIGAGSGGSQEEQVANRYAADLLMPAFMFDPAARKLSKLDLRAVCEMADIFRVSRTAAAVRLIEGSYFAAVLICHGKHGLKWFKRSPLVPDSWWPNRELDSESYAMDVLFGRKPEDSFPRKIGADAWFNRLDADRFEVREQTMRDGTGQALTLVLLDDARMLES